MKKYTSLLLLLVATLIWSCKNTNSPQAVTEKFLNSFVQMDYETAKSLSTKNTWELLDIWASFAKDIPESVKKQKAESFKVKITDNKRESDSTVIITYTTEPKILPFNKLRLLRQTDIEGRERWKVDISTLDLIGGEELYIEEEQKAIEVERVPADTIRDKED
ncbi:DUF4878 domain-containing protein [Taibaiella koreensis]|uniref:DUF4878 domain-containing protein n=1 Tax=Taibaiella koreensis TaxID=1268548 RepID=UPI000E59935A|nr:DUF4878 domain-containing protein [Taibaiella koreensis]